MGRAVSPTRCGKQKHQCKQTTKSILPYQENIICFLLLQSTPKIDIRVISKVTLITLSLTHYPLFQWYPQSKEIFIKSQYEC